MALIPCEECTREISSRASACPHCGCPVPVGQAMLADRDVATFAATPPPPVPSQRFDRVQAPPIAQVTEFACPACRSENVRRLPLIYRDGMAVVRSTTAGVGAGWDGAGGFGAATQGSQQSLSSMGAAPPTEKKVGAGVAMAVFGLLLLSAGGFVSFLGLCMLVGGGFTLYDAARFNRDVFPGLLYTWENTFLCQRCGERYVHSAAM